MPLTGRYDFKGIQKAVRRLVQAAALSTTWGAWLIASPFKPAIDAAEDLLINWLTNRGLIVLDIAEVVVNGKVDQGRLDAALNDAFTKLQKGRDKITPEEGARIDQEVANAFDQSADLGASDPTPSRLPNLPGHTL